MLLRCFLVSNSFFNIPNKQLFSFRFFTLTKRSEKRFSQFRNFIILLSYSTHTLHKNFVFWQFLIKNLFICKTNFYKLLLLLSGDVSLNPESIQGSEDINSTMWELLNKKGLCFLHININSLLSEKDEIRCIGNNTKSAITRITESKLDHTVPDPEVLVLRWYCLLNHLLGDFNINLFQNCK